MEAFVKKQIFYSPMVFLERTLPKEGEIRVKVGDQVAAFDVLAHTYLSLMRKDLVLPKGTQMLVEDGEAVSAGQALAKKSKFLSAQVFKAPFSGSVKILDGGLSLEISSSPERYNLVSGIAAKVVKVVPKLSLLLQTSASLVQGVWASGSEVVGEIRFIEEAVGVSLASKLGPEIVGKIIVCPGFVNDAFLQKAKVLGVAGIVCGALEYRLEQKYLTVLVTEGFGKAEMPKKLVQGIKQFELKTGVISPARRQLIIPNRPSSEPNLFNDFMERREIKVGDNIQILNWPYFSEEAVVVELLGPTLFESSIKEEGLLVKRNRGGELIKVPTVNIMILE